jgi:hypothetical protein
MLTDRVGHNIELERTALRTHGANGAIGVYHELKSRANNHKEFSEGFFVKEGRARWMFVCAPFRKFHACIITVWAMKCTLSLGLIRRALEGRGVAKSLTNNMNQ